MNVFQDWKSTNSSKGKVLTLLFRIASIGNKNIICKILLFPYLIFYKFFVEWILGFELPYNTKVGKGLRIFHGQSLVINKEVVIGADCTFRHCVTIGNISTLNHDCPVLGDNVDVGANVCILGNISIGNNVKIGAGSIVIKDVPSNCVVVGNPARLVKYLN